MQSPSNGVAILLQPYSDEKEGDGGGRPRGALVPQILKVRDYVVWSLFNFAFWNFCCLGFVAFLFSVKSRDHKVVGDVENASYYGRRAKWLNIVLTLLSIVLIAMFIVLIVNGDLPALLREMRGQQQLPPDWNKYSGK
ncbi:hypothetical protein lerEdw1_005238 [Lerista edwardsae]|nr:hypothetical protein lerEdw1_005238 [Lerista edwardsae]